MYNEILINSGAKQVRAAVIDGGSVSEIFIERLDKKSVTGNIYKGKVVKVLPGMQSAFVEIGLNKAAFLHVADIISAYKNDIADDEIAGEEVNGDDEVNIRDFENDDEINGENSLPQSYYPIEEILHEGDEIIVQVKKDAISTKGARLTTNISIPGRYLVLMPYFYHIGISRKIEKEEERKRLKDILVKLHPDKMGLIARTVSEGLSEEEIAADLNYIKGVWDNLESAISNATTPSLIYEDHNLIYKILRDIVRADTSKILIDNMSDYEKMQEFFKNHLLNKDLKIEYYDKKEPLFDLYNIEIEINKLQDKKVWLRSGGSIIIEQTEALTVIDVNTSKYVGSHNFDDTILKTNLEATKEIAHQLRLRNIGGIIIVDFIDMERLDDRQKVLNTLEQYLKEDRVKSSIINISPLGLVEITRKRVRDSITRIITEPCPHCEGKGVVKSKITVCYEIMGEVLKIAKNNTGIKIIIEAHKDVADLLLTYERETTLELEKKYNVTIEINQNTSCFYDRYKIKRIG